jgi:hypothetical protein
LYELEQFTRLPSSKQACRIPLTDVPAALVKFNVLLVPTGFPPTCMAICAYAQVKLKNKVARANRIEKSLLVDLTAGLGHAVGFLISAANWSRTASINRFALRAAVAIHPINSIQTLIAAACA